MGQVNTEQVLKERGTQYGESWRLTGWLMSMMASQYADMVKKCPEAGYPFVAILNKLTRALISPNKVDHWVDIINYAQLMKDHLEGKGDIRG